MITSSESESRGPSETELEPALHRLSAALSALEAAVDSRRSDDAGDHEARLRELGAERMRLLSVNERLTKAHTEVSRRLDSAISTIQTIVDD